jgi:hypothetical protein
VNGPGEAIAAWEAQQKAEAARVQENAELAAEKLARVLATLDYRAEVTLAGSSAVAPLFDGEEGPVRAIAKPDSTGRVQVTLEAAEGVRWLPAGPLGTLADIGRAIVEGPLPEPHPAPASTDELLASVLRELIRDVVLDVVDGTS